MTRPSTDAILMGLACLWAQRSTCSSRVAVGAVLVTTDRRVIATGYNGSPKGLPHCDEVGCDLDSDGKCQRAVHAEENAILQCAVHGISSQGTVLYTTHSPCERCSARIIQAGISRVVYLHVYRRVTELPGIPVEQLPKDDYQQMMSAMFKSVYNENQRWSK